MVAAFSTNSFATLVSAVVILDTNEPLPILASSIASSSVSYGSMVDTVPRVVASGEVPM